VFEFAGDPKRGKTRRRLWELARALVPKERPGDYNQGLMEIGAVVCTPASPSCGLCPIADYCGALRNGSVDRFPAAGPRSVSEKVEAAAAVILRRGEVLVAQRPEGEALGGMWEFPVVERKGVMQARSLLRRSVRRSTGLDIEIGERLVRVSHSIMTRRIAVEAFLCKAISGKARAIQYKAVQWLSPDGVGGLPLPSAPRQIAEALVATLDAMSSAGGRQCRVQTRQT